MDNLVDSNMIIEYLNGKGAAQGGSVAGIQYGIHIDIVRYINEQVYSMNVTPYSADYALDMLDNGSWIVLKRPQEWSVSLAKTLSLTEELFQTDCSATVYI